MEPRTRVEHEKMEREYLQKNAAFSSDPKYTERSYPYEADHYRGEFHRDYTRIIHCRSFRRLRHKTQVFISPRNDHLCTRMEHSLHVASVAKTIARALCLNEDLVEAMAVGHDLGHAPFGHKGEKILREIAENNGSSFSHELHSLRLVDTLDSSYPNHPGLNLTFAVRDGIACHYGEGFEQTLTPDREKHPDSLKTMKRGEGRPATLEGCIVRWADKIAYLGRDLEDAVILGLVKKEDVPPVVQEKLGTTNRDIIANLVKDLVQHSSDDRLSVSGPIHEALTAFYSFSMENIYRTDKATKHYPQIERATHFLFDFLLEELGRTRGDPEEFLASSEYHLRVFGEFLRDDVRDQNAEHPQLVIDFIAGMTDSFFADAFKALFLPFSTV